jgi:hypothetical protein
MRLIQKDDTAHNAHFYNFCFLNDLKLLLLWRDLFDTEIIHYNLGRAVVITEACLNTHQEVSVCENVELVAYIPDQSEEVEVN